MNKDLENKLISKFPDLFRETKLSPQESCMGRGLEIQDGWFPIVYAASEAINGHLKKLKDAGKPLNFAFVQIKEKFATIRIVDNGGDEFIDGVVSMAEWLSSITCEVCGKSGGLCKSKSGFWLMTLCDEDAAKLKYERKNP